MTSSLSFSIGSRGVLPQFERIKSAKRYEPATEFADNMRKEGNRFKTLLKAGKRLTKDGPIEVDDEDEESGVEKKEVTPETPKRKKQNPNPRRRKPSYRRSKGSGNNSNSGGSGNVPVSDDADYNSNSNNGGSMSRNGGRQDSNESSVRWNSGLESGIVLNPYQKYSDEYTSLYMLNGELFPKKGATGNNYYQNALKRLIFHEMVTLLASVNQRFTDYFTYQNFEDYMDTITSALQLYYSVDSILTYYNNNNSSVMNQGLLHIHREFTMDVLSRHHELGKFLESFEMPKNLVYFVRYFYQNFQYGSEPFSPIVRMGYKTYFQTHRVENEMLDASVYDNIRFNLGQYCTQTSAELSKARRYGRGNGLFKGVLPKSTTVMKLDKQFLTFWHNANVSYLTKDGMQYTRSVNFTNEKLYYGSYVPDVDGVIYASSSIAEVTKEVNTLNEERVSEDRVTLHTGIWRPFNRYRLGQFNTADASALCIFKDDAIGIVPASKSLNCSASKIYAVPVRPANDAAWQIERFGDNAANPAQTHSIDNLRMAVDLSTAHIMRMK
jgi:hypothetical protein